MITRARSHAAAVAVPDWSLKVQSGIDDAQASFVVALNLKRRTLTLYQQIIFISPFNPAQARARGISDYLFGFI